MSIYRTLIKVFNMDTAFSMLKFCAGLAMKVPFLIPSARYRYKTRKDLSVELFNMKFSNPLALGPGLDREGTHYNVFREYGFSFIETGPCNEGNIRKVISRVQDNPSKGILGVCINKDYERTFSLAYDFFDLFDIELSEEMDTDILARILDIRLGYDVYKPVLLRIRYDLPQDILEQVIDFSRMNGIDGLIVAKAENVRRAARLTSGRFPIIGYGGIRTPEAAEEMLEAGASMIQITTGLVLDGPSLAKKILKYLDNK